MNITRAKLKETLRTIVNEESEYQSFFKAALEKAGKSIPSMSDEEKKAFFNKIDAAWDGKGEKNEALVGNQHKLDIDKDGDIGSDDLADLRAGKKVDESVNEGKKVFKVNPNIGKAKYSISSHDGVKKHKDGSDFFDIEIFKNKVDLEKAIKNYTSKGFVKESVNESTKDDDYADELQKATEKVLKGKNIKGWKLAVDNMSGTFEFQKNGIDLIIYATPMWDGNPNLPFNVMDGNGDEVDMIEKLIGNKLPFKPSYDLKKDISNYISVLTKILPKVEQAYGKLKKESVNEVTESNDKLMKIGSTMMVGGNNLLKPVKMKLVAIDYLPKDKKYSYKFQGGGRTQYYTDDVLIKKLKSESVNEDANPKFFPNGKKEWAKSASFFDGDKVDILLITSKYKDVNDAYYIFKKDGRFIGSADSIKGGKPSGTKVNVKLSDVSNAKSIGDLKKMIGESVNEEKPGLWANIRAKKARGEKPAHGNSDAHKDAVAAGKKINKEESVNEAPEVKKRFMFDFYTDSNQRNTERETNFLATTLESAIKAAEHICKVTGYAYVEIYYKDLFLGSMKKQNGFKFVEGRGYSKFKSTN